MAVKRDYGSLSKACARLLPPLVKHLGYTAYSGSCFYRDRGPLRDVFGFQQSQWGSGSFCVHLGIGVPSAERFWEKEDSEVGRIVGDRLQPDGSFRTGDHWWDAENKDELTSSLRGVVHSLELANSWLQSFKSIDDVVAERLRNVGPREGWGTDVDTNLMGLGFLRIAAGSLADAEAHLLEAQRAVHQSIESERMKHLENPRTKNKAYVPYYVYPWRLERIKKALAFIHEQNRTS